MLYRATRAGRKWDVTRIAELAGTDPAMLVGDIDRDGVLDAIVAGAAFVGGRLDVRDPVVGVAWPAGLACRP